MNMYLDFEATQFGEHIIAIGAHCNNGDFDCLVQPPMGDKITPFITQLTGITKEMMINAPTAEEAFTSFYSWISEIIEYNPQPVFFHVYGSNDADFLHKTAKHIDNPEVAKFVKNLAYSLIDDSKQVCKYFHAKTIGVHRALNYFEPELTKQNHDPLDDAILLAKLMKHIEIAEPLDECPYPQCCPAKTEKKKTVISSDMVIGHNLQNPEAKPKTFVNTAAAIDWVVTRITNTFPDANKKKIKNKIKKAINENGEYYGRRWEIVKEVNNG